MSEKVRVSSASEGVIAGGGVTFPPDRGGNTELEKLRQLSAAATPGPWTHGRTNWRRQRTDWWGIFPPRRIGVLPMFSLPPRPVAHLEAEELDQADAAFIVAAVNHVRSLLVEPIQNERAPVRVGRTDQGLGGVNRESALTAEGSARSMVDPMVAQILRTR